MQITRNDPSDPSVLVLLDGRKKKSPLKGKAFVKVMPADMSVVVGVLEPEGAHLFLWLISKVQWQTNLVVGVNEQALSVADITEQYTRKVSERYIIKLLNGLCAVGVVARSKCKKQTQFYVNPAVVYFGESPDETLLSIFRVQRESYIKNREGNFKPANA